MSAAAGGGFSVESIDGLREHDPSVLKTAIDESQKAFEKVVDFLVTQIGVPSDSIVPYANQLVVLAEIFRQCPKPTSSQYLDITTWFWRSAVSGYFSGWNTGNMTRDKSAVTDYLKGKSSEISVSAYKPNSKIWQTKVFRADNAHAKTLAIILAHHQPIDLLTGLKIDTTKSISWTNAKEYHHFFPRDYLKAKGVSMNDSNCLANIVLLSSTSNKTITNRPPSDYLKDVVAAAGTKLDNWLESNLISRPAFDAAMKDDFQAFVTERSKTIDSIVAGLTDW